MRVNKVLYLAMQIFGNHQANFLSNSQVWLYSGAKNIRGMRQMLNRMNNLQISDDVFGHIKFNEVIRNITEIQFRSK